jgi:hypothetical protein
MKEKMEGFGLKNLKKTGRRRMVLKDLKSIETTYCSYKRFNRISG